MAFNEELALRIRAALSGHDGVVEKKMFGGIAFMLQGNMCVGVTGCDLMVRVGPNGLDDAMAQPHARPMDFTGRPMKGFVYVEPAGTEKDDSLKRWVQRGVAFVASLPAK
ncbi:MAG: RNA methyltransferase [SAR202 cluster bacterium Io17-Chloro-G2]|nr:MAG: RNA methyltransferase [SAR202 cluster bacterium Io17-Chloro-G2]